VRTPGERFHRELHPEGVQGLLAPLQGAGLEMDSFTRGTQKPRTPSQIPGTPSGVLVTGSTGGKLTLLNQLAQKIGKPPSAIADL